MRKSEGMTNQQLAVYIEQIRQNLQQVYEKIEDELPESMERFEYNIPNILTGGRIQYTGCIKALAPLSDYIDSLEKDRDMLGEYE